MEFSPPIHHNPKEECLMRNIITQENEINNFISEKRFDFLPSVSRKHIHSMLLSFTERGNSGKTADSAKYSPTHRTSSGHFLSKGKWDEHCLNQPQKREIFSTMEAQALETGKPLYVSIDNTVWEKTKPSSNAKHPMEKAGWHFSHKPENRCTIISFSEFIWVREMPDSAMIWNDMIKKIERKFR